MADVLELTALALRCDDFHRDTVLQHARGVVHRAEDQARVAFIRGDERLLDVVMDRRFLRRTEARAHVHAFRAQCERTGHAAAITNAA